MILEQFYLGCLAHASYIVGDERAGIAAVVDPQRDIQQYLDFAQSRGLVIKYVLLTHFHADFVAGHLDLAQRTGARIVLSSAGETEFDVLGLEDGQSIELGDVRITGLQTPGHTPESMTYLVYDLTADAEAPQAALTGDTLFIGDVGRPDLLASIGFTNDELGRMLYHSIHEKLLRLPDATLVYPAHGAGSMCGKALSDEKFSTIGAQRKENYALQPMSEADFVALVSSGQPEAPKYFVHDAIMNRKQHATLADSLARSMRPLALDDVLRLADAGAQLVDVRPAAEFAASHLTGSLGIGLDGKFATWAGYVLELEAPIVLLGSKDQVDEAAVRLGRVGLDRVAGYLDGGIDMVDDATLLEGFERLDPDDLKRRIDETPTATILDVRTANEFAEGHIEGALNVPLNQLPDRIGEVPAGEVVVICRSGYRSILGASLLQRAGHKDVLDLAGGMQAWEGATCTAGA
jgi:hydroxyacylglutathione hydrolase